MQRSRIAVSDTDARTSQLIFRIGRDRHVGKRRDYAFLSFNRGMDGFPLCVEIAPVATLKPEKCQKTAHVFVVGLEFEERFAIGSALFKPLHDQQSVDA